MRLADLTDTFSSRRDGTRQHEATDILAARGTPVVAVEDGTIKQLFLSKAGGITIYQFDPSERYCYYYAHLDHYAAGMQNGTKVKKGDVIGYVGTTGNAGPNNPHLHFEITIVRANKQYWGGVPIDPYPILRSAFERARRLN
ncbi:MAG: M23 family metallopeptidase [Bryobacteraceae bacterium]